MVSQLLLYSFASTLSRDASGYVSGAVCLEHSLKCLLQLSNVRSLALAKANAWAASGDTLLFDSVDTALAAVNASQRAHLTAGAQRPLLAGKQGALCSVQAIARERTRLL